MQLSVTVVRSRIGLKPSKDGSQWKSRSAVFELQPYQHTITRLLRAQHNGYQVDWTLHSAPKRVNRNLFVDVNVPDPVQATYLPSRNSIKLRERFSSKNTSQIAAMATHQTPPLVKKFLIALHEEIFVAFETCSFDLAQYESLKTKYYRWESHGDPVPNSNRITMELDLENIWHGENILKISRTFFKRVEVFGQQAMFPWLKRGLTREILDLLALKKSFDRWKKARGEATGNVSKLADWASEVHAVQAIHRCAFVRALIVATMPAAFITRIRHGIVTTTVDDSNFASQKEILLENPHCSTEELKLAQIWSYSLQLSQQAEVLIHDQLEIADLLVDELTRRQEADKHDETVVTVIKEQGVTDANKSQNVFSIKQHEHDAECTAGQDVSPDKGNVARHTADDEQYDEEETEPQENIYQYEPLAASDRDFSAIDNYRDHTGWLAKTDYQMKITGWTRANNRAGRSSQPSQFTNDTGESIRRQKVKTRGIPEDTRQADIEQQPLEEATNPSGTKIWRFTNPRQYETWRMLFPLPGEPDRANELTWTAFVRVMEAAPLSFTAITCSRGGNYNFTRPPKEGMAQMSFTVHKPHAAMDCQKEFARNVRKRLAGRWGWSAEHFVLEET